MSDIELKPCPFCGHQPKLWGEDGNIHGVQIECVNGRCPSEPHVWENTSAEAIAAWNTRYKPKAEELFDQQIAEYVKRGKP